MRVIGFVLLAQVLLLSACGNQFDDSIGVTDAKEKARLLMIEADKKFGKNDFFNCELELDRLIRLDPTVAHAYYVRACCRHIRHNYPAALMDCDESIKLEPNGNPIVYFQRGLTKYRLGNVEGSKLDLSTAIRKRPDFGPSYLIRAYARANSEDLDGALADCDKLLKLEPHNAEAINLRKRLLAASASP